MEESTPPTPLPAVHGAPPISDDSARMQDSQPQQQADAIFAAGTPMHAQADAHAPEAPARADDTVPASATVGDAPRVDMAIDESLAASRSEAYVRDAATAASEQQPQQQAASMDSSAVKESKDVHDALEDDIAANAAPAAAEISMVEGHATDAEQAPVARRLRERKRPPLPVEDTNAAAAAESSSAEAAAAAPVFTMTSYLASLPPLQSVRFTRALRPAAAATRAPPTRVPAAYKRELKGMSPAELAGECESLYLSLEKLKRDGGDAAERPPASNVRWSDSVELQSVTAAGPRTLTLSEHTFDADALPQDEEELAAATEADEATAIVADFTAPLEGVCSCKCECVSSSSCYCRCDEKPKPTAADLNAAGASAASRTSSSCTCKCYCERPKNWPKGVRYTRSIHWTPSALAVTSAAASSAAAVSTPPFAQVLYDRLLQAHAPPATPLHTQFSIRRSTLNAPPSAAAASSASSSSSAGSSAGMGLVSKVAFRKGTARILDYTGEIFIEDKRPRMKTKDFDVKRWKDVPVSDASATATAAAASADEEGREQKELKAPRNSKYCFPLFHASSAEPFDVYIDALRCGNEARMINDPREKRKCNVEFKTYIHEATGEMRLGLDCIKDIHPGDEIFVSYGSAYWRSMRHYDEALDVYKRAVRNRKVAEQRRAAARAEEEEERRAEAKREARRTKLKRKAERGSSSSSSEGSSSDSDGPAKRSGSSDDGDNDEDDEEADRRAMRALFAFPASPPPVKPVAPAAAPVSSAVPLVIAAAVAPAPPVLVPAASAASSTVAAAAVVPPSPSTPTAAAAISAASTPPVQLSASSSAASAAADFAPPSWTFRASDQHFCCTLCTRSYLSQEQFDYHWHKLHSARYTCSRLDCTYQAGNAARLAEHEMKHARTAAAGHASHPAKRAKLDHTSPNAKADDSGILKMHQPERVVYSRAEWEDLQRKKALLARCCSISAPMMFGSTLKLPAQVQQSQEAALVPFLASPASSLFHESTAAPMVSKQQLGSRFYPDGFDAWPLDFVGVHELQGSGRTHSRLLKIPILAPDHTFAVRDFTLPRSIISHALESAPFSSFAGHRRPSMFVHYNLGDPRAEADSGWGATMQQLLTHSRAVFREMASDEDTSDEEASQHTGQGAGAAATTTAATSSTGPFVVQLHMLPGPAVGQSLRVVRLVQPASAEAPLRVRGVYVLSTDVLGVAFPDHSNSNPVTTTRFRPSEKCYLRIVCPRLPSFCVVFSCAGVQRLARLTRATPDMREWMLGTLLQHMLALCNVEMSSPVEVALQFPVPADPISNEGRHRTPHRAVGRIPARASNSQSAADGGGDARRAQHMDVAAASMDLSSAPFVVQEFYLFAPASTHTSLVSANHVGRVRVARVLQQHGAGAWSVRGVFVVAADLLSPGGGKHPTAGADTMSPHHQRMLRLPGGKRCIGLRHCDMVTEAHSSWVSEDMRQWMLGTLAQRMRALEEEDVRAGPAGAFHADMHHQSATTGDPIGATRMHRLLSSASGSMDAAFMMQLQQLRAPFAACRADGNIIDSAATPAVVRILRVLQNVSPSDSAPAWRLCGVYALLRDVLRSTGTKGNHCDHFMDHQKAYVRMPRRCPVSTYNLVLTQAGVVRYAGRKRLSVEARAWLLGTLVDAMRALAQQDASGLVASLSPDCISWQLTLPSTPLSEQRERAVIRPPSSQQATAASAASFRNAAAPSAGGPDTRDAASDTHSDTEDEPMEAAGGEEDEDDDEGDEADHEEDGEGEDEDADEDGDDELPRLMPMHAAASQYARHSDEGEESKQHPATNFSAAAASSSSSAALPFSPLRHASSDVAMLHSIPSSGSEQLTAEQSQPPRIPAYASRPDTVQAMDIDT